MKARVSDLTGVLVWRQYQRTYQDCFVPSQSNMCACVHCISGIMAHAAEPQRTHRSSGLQSAGKVWGRKPEDATGTTAGEICALSFEIFFFFNIFIIIILVNLYLFIPVLMPVTRFPCLLLWGSSDTSWRLCFPPLNGSHLSSCTSCSADRCWLYFVFLSFCWHICSWSSSLFSSFSWISTTEKQWVPASVFTSRTASRTFLFQWRRWAHVLGMVALHVHCT